MEAAYLYDPTKVVKITFKDVDGPAGTNGAPADVTPDDKPINVPDEKKLGRQKKASKPANGGQKPGEA